MKEKSDRPYHSRHLLIVSVYLILQPIQSIEPNRKLPDRKNVSPPRLSLYIPHSISGYHPHDCNAVQRGRFPFTNLSDREYSTIIQLLFSNLTSGRTDCLPLLSLLPFKYSVTSSPTIFHIPFSPSNYRSNSPLTHLIRIDNPISLNRVSSLHTSTSGIILSHSLKLLV